MLMEDLGWRQDFVKERFRTPSSLSCEELKDFLRGLGCDTQTIEWLTMGKEGGAPVSLEQYLRHVCDGDDRAGAIVVGSRVVPLSAEELEGVLEKWPIPEEDE